MSHPTVSRDEWLAARKTLLAKEKQFSKARDELAAERRALPWVMVEKAYVFDAPGGKQSLADLFGGKNQLLVYHFMLGPGWSAGCPSCSFLADHFDGAVIHLVQRDVSFVVVSRAPLPEIEAYKKRMGWRFPWVSSFNNDFNRDFHVSFTKDELAAGEVEYNYAKTKLSIDEMPGMSAFIKENGAVFHTYSSYSRGLDILVGAYNMLDLTPKGRDEGNLSWSMAWVKRHDEYEKS